MSGNDGFTKVLLHMNGTNGSTTITDDNAGGSAHTWTAGGTSNLTTTSPKFGSACGNFDGSASSFFTTPDSSDFALGTGNFTVDFWFKTSSASRIGLASQGSGASATSAFLLEMGQSGAGKIQTQVFSGSSLIVNLNSTATYNDGNWHHYALVRSGNNFLVFFDGTQDGSATSSGSVNHPSRTLNVGTYDDSDGFNWIGTMDEFRLSVGTARWTSNFTPPTTEYSADAGVPYTPWAQLAPIQAQ